MKNREKFRDEIVEAIKEDNDENGKICGMGEGSDKRNSVWAGHALEALRTGRGRG